MYLAIYARRSRISHTPTFTLGSTALEMENFSFYSSSSCFAKFIGHGIELRSPYIPIYPQPIENFSWKLFKALCSSSLFLFTSRVLYKLFFLSSGFRNARPLNETRIFQLKLSIKNISHFQTANKLATHTSSRTHFQLFSPNDFSFGEWASLENVTSSTHELHSCSCELLSEPFDAE